MRRALPFAAATAAYTLRLLVRASLSRASGGRGQPEIVLHIGQHKTGSTTIQAVMLRCRAELEACGIHVVRTGQWVHGAHHRLVGWLAGGHPAAIGRALFRLELAQTPARTLLISSESALRVIRHGGGGRLVDALRDAGAGRVRLFLYLRSPFASANSNYAHLTSWFELGGATFAEFLGGYRRGHRLDPVLELAQRDDVLLTVRPFDQAVRGSVASDFLDTLGAPLRLEAEPRLNTSLGPVALEAMRSLCAESQPLPRRLRIRLCTRLREIGASLPEQPFWGVDEAHERLLRLADEHVEAFARAVWGRGWREMLGEERRPLSVFDPDDPRQAELYRTTVAAMREAKADLGIR